MIKTIVILQANCKGKSIVKANCKGIVKTKIRF